MLPCRRIASTISPAVTSWQTQISWSLSNGSCPSHSSGSWIVDRGSSDEWDGSRSTNQLPLATSHCSFLQPNEVPIPRREAKQGQRVAGVDDQRGAADDHRVRQIP